MSELMDDGPGDQAGEPEIGDEEVGASQETGMSRDQGHASWSAAQWRGKLLVDSKGDKIGKLQEVYVDVETDQPQFGTVKEGIIGRHLTFVPLGGARVGPDSLVVAVTKERSAPPPTLTCTATSFLRQTSQLFTTTSSSTTPRPLPRAGAVLPAADAAWRWRHPARPTVAAALAGFA